tara:strand:- start:752 stop:2830 length:2079 start_codon:yes stop_codon:yes gene_type:complete
MNDRSGVSKVNQLSSSQKIKEIVMPSVHVNVKLNDLNQDGRLLTKPQVEEVIKKVSAIRDTSQYAHLKKKDVFNRVSLSYAQRFKKSELQSNYGVIVFEDNYYAVYRGVKQDCHLGSGGFGYAKLVQNIETGEWAVLKLSAPRAKGSHEYEMLDRLGLAVGQLERVASLGSEYVKAQQREHPSFYMLSQHNMVMKLAPGQSLQSLRAANKKLTDIQLLQVIVATLKAYEVLQKKNIIHGDLSDNNIFYDFIANKATVIDFGNANKKPILPAFEKNELIFTPGYAAPELLHAKNKKKNRYTVESDIYALGAVIQSFLKKDDEDRHCQRIIDPKLRETVRMFARFTMCHEKRNCRPTLADAIHFFEQALQQQLNMLPKPVQKIAVISLDEYRVGLIATADAISHSSSGKEKVVEEEYSLLTRLFLGVRRALIDGDDTNAGCEPDNQAGVQCMLADEASVAAAHMKLVDSLKLFDQVWFVDSAHHSTKEYLQLSQELASSGVLVGNKCFITSELDVGGQLMAFADHLNPVVHQLNKYYGVSARLDQDSVERLLPTSVCPIAIRQDADLNDLAYALECFSASDIGKEYETIKVSLSSLADQYQTAGISDIFNTAIKEMDEQYALGKLSFSEVNQRLDTIQQAAKEAGKISDQKVSLQGQLVKHHSLFAKKSQSMRDAEAALAAIQSQFNSWAASYS